MEENDFGAIAGIFLPVIFVSALGSFRLGRECAERKDGKQLAILFPNQNARAFNQCQEYFATKKSEVEADITKTSAEKNTLKNQIATLTKKLKDWIYQIFNPTLPIKSLGFQITDTEDSITETEKEIELQKEKIGLILQAWPMKIISHHRGSDFQRYDFRTFFDN
jgi:peptidoglycan hydrolase CwlO-like protein